MNPKINRRAAHFDLEVIKSPIHRYGVIALEDIPARRRVIEYTGRLYNRRDAKALYANEPESPLIYIWEIGYPAYWIIDGATNGSGAELINHSCDPNLNVEFRGKRVYYRSRRAIKKGEELTVDYRFDWDPGFNVKCACGSPKCRGFINFPPEGYFKIKKELEKTRAVIKRLEAAGVR
jgi:uncharacterized protein